MFGMLDYRAHKLYLLLTFIPNIVLYLFAIFALPLINYSVGLGFADERIFQILISLLSLVVVEIIWILFALFFSKSMDFIFSLFIDVIPHDGRTKEEAQLVVWHGEKAINIIALQKHPKTWTDEVIYNAPKVDWIMNFYFNFEMTERLYAIRDHYISSPTTPFNESRIEQILEENNMSIKNKEKILTNRNYRRALISYSIFLLLLIINPF